MEKDKIININDIRINMPVRVKIKDITLDETNPNEMTEADMKALMESIKRDGFDDPIITNKDLVVADGHHRVIAARRLGMSEISAVVLDMDEVSRRRIRQVRNKLKGKHDKKKDLADFEWFKEQHAIPELKAFLPGEINNIDLALEPPEIKDDKTDNVSKLGSLVVECPNCKHKFKRGESKKTEG